MTYLNNDAASGLRAECLANFVNPDAATGACAGFQADFIARMAPQAFEGWTEACIRHLSPLAFSEVKSEQWPFMNSSACRGFLFETVLLFNKTSGAGMTAACLSQFSDSDGRSGCAGLFGPFVGSLDLAAFSALSAKCIYVATAEIFANISPAQFAALPAASCNGIVSYQAMNFPLTLAHVLTSECLAQFSTTNDSLAGCSGLRLDFVEQIPPATFAGLTKECINVAKSDFFLGVNATQISYIPATTFQGITQVEATAILAWANTSVAQLSNLSADGFSGVVPTALQTVVNVHKLDLVNVLTVQQTASYPQQFATEFKGLTPHAVAYLTEWSTVAQDLSTATWLKIALLKQADQQRAVQGPVFNAETLTHLPFSAYEGLRADHVPLIAAADFTLLNASHTSYFTKDMIGSLSIDQLRQISPQAFSAISWVAISGLNPSLVAEITSEQIASLTQTQIGSFNCSQLQAFTTFQLVSFNQEQQQIFEEDVSIIDENTEVLI